MAHLMFLRNPLSLRDRITVELEPGVSPLDWLLENYPPHQVDAPIVYYLNGVQGDAQRDLDRIPDADDYIILARQPAGPAIGTIIITAVITAIISTAASLLISLILAKPSAPNAVRADSDAKQSPAYDVRASQNIARLGEPVPAVYGIVLATPDYCAQPYVYYENNQQYLDLLFCLGHGEFMIQQVLLGDTDVSTIIDGSFSYAIVPAAQHMQSFGNLGFHADFKENVVTSPEVGDQEFHYQNDQSGWYRLSKSGQVGRYVQIDIEWPQGFYQRMDQGDITGTGISMTVYVQEVDANGQLIDGTMQFFEQSHSGNSPSPLRNTWTFDCGRSASWAIRLVRNTVAEPNGNEVNWWLWRSAKLICDPAPAGTVYGNTTLMAVRIRATAVASTAQRQIRVKMWRLLPHLGTPPNGLTTAGLDAFVDIFCNTDYGAGRPLTEIDIDRLATLYPIYGDGYDFSAIYTQRTTVWEALQHSLQGVAAQPLPIAGLMSLAQDGVQAVRSRLWTEQSIVANSFKLHYSWDNAGAPDGVEIAFRDLATWQPAYAKYPTASETPERIELFGCTRLDHAQQFARLTWQRRLYQRRGCEFDTELEGLIPQPGERIGIAHTLPRWGVNGFVAIAQGLTITLDRDLPWSDWVGPYFMIFRTERGEASNVVNVVRGVSDRQAILANDPFLGLGDIFHTDPSQEPTHFSWGDGSRVVRDFTVTEVKPTQPTRVKISCVRYDPAVFAGTMPFLQSPIPP